MATVKYIMEVITNKISIELDDFFVGKEVIITITTKNHKKSNLEVYNDSRYETISLDRKPDENVIDDVPAWSNLFKNPKPEIKKEEPKKEESEKDFSDKVTISKKIIIDKFDYEDSNSNDSISDKDKEFLNSFTFEEDRPDINTNIIEDEPNWNSNKPLDKDFDILGHSEKNE